MFTKPPPFNEVRNPLDLRYLPEVDLFLKKTLRRLKGALDRASAHKSCRIRGRLGYMITYPTKLLLMVEMHLTKEAFWVEAFVSTNDLWAKDAEKAKAWAADMAQAAEAMEAMEAEFIKMGFTKKTPKTFGP